MTTSARGPRLRAAVRRAAGRQLHAGVALVAIVAPILVAISGTGAGAQGGSLKIWLQPACTVPAPEVCRAPPFGQSPSNLAYDGDRFEMVYFVSDPSAGPGTTWVWSDAVEAWEQPDPPHEPTGWSEGMVYDPSAHQVVLVTALNSDRLDTWTWDGNDWTEQHPANAPLARSATSVAYVPRTHTVVLYGGSLVVNHGFTGPCGQVVPAHGAFGDTWSWDGHDWTLHCPEKEPPARGYTGPNPTAPVAQPFAPITTDPHTGGAILLARTSDGFQTWSWTGRIWHLAQPPPRTEPPPGSYWLVDARNNVLALGLSAGNWSEWSWDGSNWSKQLTLAQGNGKNGEIASGPDVSAFVAAFDSDQGKAFVFGSPSGSGAGSSSGSGGSSNAETWLEGTQAFAPQNPFEPQLEYRFDGSGDTVPDRARFPCGAETCPPDDGHLFGGAAQVPAAQADPGGDYGWADAAGALRVPAGGYLQAPFPVSQASPAQIIDFSFRSDACHEESCADVSDRSVKNRTKILLDLEGGASQPAMQVALTRDFTTDADYAGASPDGQFLSDANGTCNLCVPNPSHGVCRLCLGDVTAGLLVSLPQWSSDVYLPGLNLDDGAWHFVGIAVTAGSQAGVSQISVDVDGTYPRGYLRRPYLGVPWLACVGSCAIADPQQQESGPLLPALVQPFAFAGSAPWPTTLFLGGDPNGTAPLAPGFQNGSAPFTGFFHDLRTYSLRVPRPLSELETTLTADYYSNPSDTSGPAMLSLGAGRAGNDGLPCVTDSLSITGTIRNGEGEIERNWAYGSVVAGVSVDFWLRPFHGTTQVWLHITRVDLSSTSTDGSLPTAEIDIGGLPGQPGVSSAPVVVAPVVVSYLHLVYTTLDSDKVAGYLPVSLWYHAPITNSELGFLLKGSPVTSDLGALALPFANSDFVSGGCNLGEQWP